MKPNLARLSQLWHAQAGRPIAIVLLLALAVLLSFPEQSPFRIARLALFDHYQKLLPRQVQTQPVVIVEIDEATLGVLGQWPWPRHYLAALIDAIGALKPAAIGLDIIMPEADHASPQALAEARPDLPASVRQQLNDSPSNDRLLSASLANTPSVLGAAGFPFRTYATREGLRSHEIQQVGENPLPWLTAYPFVLASLPEFQAAARGQAMLSSEPELGVVRRVTLLANLNGALIPGLSIELLRVAQASKDAASKKTTQTVMNTTALQVNTGTHGIESIHIGSQKIPLQANGEAWLHFDRLDENSKTRNLSALSLLKNEIPAERIHGKIVLIGLTGLGLQDRITTPHGDRRPGVEAHAQLIESFTDQHFLLRPWWLAWCEIGLLLGFGALMIWAVPQLKPRLATLFALTQFIVLFGTGGALFYWLGYLFDAASLFAALNIIFGSLLSSVFIESDRQRRAAEHALQIQRESAARVAGELEAARRIQLNSLPQASRLFAQETRFTIDAHLEPARQVGGDLYDFYMLDAQRLFFIIADVSGKGLPASLFMAVTKALTKSAALRSHDHLAQIITTANHEINRENAEMLFVTAIIGILDVNSGALEYINAGHDAPWQIKANGEIAQIHCLGGPPLCAVEDFPYPIEHLQLAAGDLLCLVTDGISEAMNTQGELYGNARLHACLLSLAPHAATLSPTQLTQIIRHDVGNFVGLAEASDDLTLLALRWQGSARNTLSAH